MGNAEWGPGTRRLSRRQALGAITGAAIGAATSLSPAAATAAGGRRRWSAPEPNPDLDVAIVGGGVSGLYAGWRLLTAAARRGLPLAALNRSGKPRVEVIEATGRTGGRLWTLTPEGMPHLRAEIGGMRFLSSQEVVSALVGAVGLPVEPFLFGDGNNLAYLRQTRVRADQWGDAGLVPYKLSSSEQGKSPGEVVMQAITDYVPEAATLDARGWEEAKRTVRVHGRPLSGHGTWNLLADALSYGGYQFARDGGGYDSFLANWNAGEIFADIAAGFKPGAHYHRISGGYERLALELRSRFEGAGGRVRMATRAVSIGREDDQLLRLALAGESGGLRTITARHVILALPQVPLQRLASASPIMREPRIRTLLRAISPQPAVKIFLGYREAWWTELGLSSGRSVTDMPVRNCYYFGTEGDQPGADPANRNSLLMASYADGLDSTFWPGYVDEKLSGGLAGPVSAPDELIEDLSRQLAEIHGLVVPSPYWTTVMDWSLEPYGAAWHFWRIGEDSAKVIPRLREPLPGLHVCGEAWSTGQGWVEGSLMTTEHLLQETFGAERPGWLPAGAYIGP